MLLEKDYYNCYCRKPEEKKEDYYRCWLLEEEKELIMVLLSLEEKKGPMWLAYGEEKNMCSNFYFSNILFCFLWFFHLSFSMFSCSPSLFLTLFFPSRSIPFYRLSVQVPRNGIAMHEMTCYSA